MTTEIRELLAQAHSVSADGQPEPITKQRALITILVARSLKGDVRAATTLLHLIPAVARASRTAGASRGHRACLLSGFRRHLIDELRKLARQTDANSATPQRQRQHLSCTLQDP